jgi:hypothetical protein
MHIIKMILVAMLTIFVVALIAGLTGTWAWIFQPYQQFSGNASGANSAN